MVNARLVETAAAPGRWRELDLMRGLAAALMVLNHVAVGSASGVNSRTAAALAFAGSFAPVVFFFLTGLGTGVQSIQTANGRVPVDVAHRSGP